MVIKPGSLHCRQILYHLSQQGSPKIALGCDKLIAIVEPLSEELDLSEPQFYHL